MSQHVRTLIDDVRKQFMIVPWQKREKQILKFIESEAERIFPILQLGDISGLSVYGEHHPRAYE